MTWTAADVEQAERLWATMWHEEYGYETEETS